MTVAAADTARDPVAALHRVAYCLDRILAEGHRVQAYIEGGRRHRRPPAGRARASATPRRHPHRAARHRQEDRGDHHPGPRRRPDPLPGRARGVDAASSTSEPGAAELRAAIKGDCHTHSHLVRRRRPHRGDGPGRHGAGPRVDGAHRPLAPPHRRPRARRRAPAGPARARSPSSTSAWRRSGSSPAWRSTSSSTARLDLDEDLLGELDVVVASVHSKLSMPAADMTRRMVLAVASPHVDILGHCTGRKVPGSMRQVGQSDFPGRVGSDASTPRSSSPPAPSSTPRSRSTAGPSARTRPTSCSSSPSSGAARSPSTPTPTPPASSSGSPSAATRRPATASRPTRSSTP